MGRRSSRLDPSRACLWESLWPSDPRLPIPVGRGGKCIVSWGTGPAAESGVPGLGDVSPQLKKGLPGHRPHEGRAVVLLASVTTLPDVG